MPIKFACHNCSELIAIMDFNAKEKGIIVKIAKRKTYTRHIEDALHILRSEIPRCPYCGAQLSWAKPLKIEVK